MATVSTCFIVWGRVFQSFGAQKEKVLLGGCGDVHRLL